MKFISIDIETTGIDPENDQILEIGAILEDTEKCLPVDECPKFHVILRHERYTGSPFALSMNQRIFDILKMIPEPDGTKDNPEKKYMEDNHIIDAKDAAGQFWAWLHELGLSRERLIFAGKNVAGFDMQFLKKLYNWNSLIKTSNRVLDPGILYVDYKNDKYPPNFETCKKRAGLDGHVSHFALEDAWDVIQLLRKKY